jgi:hypothetical protein
MNQKEYFMDDLKIEQPASNTDRTKSIEAVQATKSGQAGEPPLPTTPVARRKRWPSASLIALMLLFAIPVIGYLLQSEPATSLEGLGVALCAVACGGLLIRHVLRVLAEEDNLQEQQFKANQAAVSSPEPNPAGQETNVTTSPPGTGQNINSLDKNL